MICLGMHINVMLRFMAQVFQNPPLCSSTFVKPAYYTPCNACKQWMDALAIHK